MPEDYPAIRVETVSETRGPERAIATAARGDYYDGFVGDASMTELLDPIDYTEAEYEKEAEYIEEEYLVDDDEIVEQLTEERAKLRSLLDQLMRRGHWGPFEHAQITLAVENVSRSCMAQVTRHRHATFDVQSQRYVDFGEKDPKLPKSVLDEEHFSREDGQIALENDPELLEEVFRTRMGASFDVYQDLVNDGVPKEDARFVLPIGTPVNMTVSMNARALLHVLNMRGKGDAQWEVRRLSELVEEALAEWMPITADLWREHGPFTEAP